MARLSRSAARRRPGPLGYGDLELSLILIFPLFWAYEIGVMFSSTVNGVDFVTRWVFAAVGNRRDFVLVHAVLGLAYVAYVIVLRRRRGFSFHTVPGMVVESAIYAVTLGTFIVFVMKQLLGLELAVRGLDALGLGNTGNAIVVSLGAGVHEELVFRLGMMAGGIYVLHRAGLGRRAAIALALVASSILFSAAHHVGPYGDPFSLQVFAYRAIAGAVFGAVFYFRSLSHAVYTHFLYDFYVLVIR